MKTKEDHYYAAAAVALGAGAFLWKGYVLSILWSWFVVTTFTAPALSVPAALGIILVVRYLTLPDLQKRERTNMEKVAYPLAYMLAGGVILAVGWLVTFFL